jgi:hypothetical protein
MAVDYKAELDKLLKDIKQVHGPDWTAATAAHVSALALALIAQRLEGIESKLDDIYTQMLVNGGK